MKYFMMNRARIVLLIGLCNLMPLCAYDMFNFASNTPNNSLVAQIRDAGVELCSGIDLVRGFNATEVDKKEFAKILVSDVLSLHTKCENLAYGFCDSLEYTDEIFDLFQLYKMIENSFSEVFSDVFSPEIGCLSVVVARCKKILEKLFHLCMQTNNLEIPTNIDTK